MGQHEGCFVLAVQVAGKLHHGYALGGVHDDADRGQQVHKVHLAAGKDCAAGHAELVVTRLAFELAAGGDLIGFVITAARANRFALSLRPAHFAEHFVSSILTSLVNLTKAECAGSC